MVDQPASNKRSNQQASQSDPEKPSNESGRHTQPAGELFNQPASQSANEPISYKPGSRQLSPTKPNLTNLSLAKLSFTKLNPYTNNLAKVSL
jgi:hypothetical protein